MQVDRSAGPGPPSVGVRTRPQSPDPLSRAVTIAQLCLAAVGQRKGKEYVITGQGG